MIELQGKYNTAKVFTDTAEQSALAQIRHLCICQAKNRPVNIVENPAGSRV